MSRSYAPGRSLAKLCPLVTCTLLTLLTGSALAASGTATRERAARKACLSGDSAQGVAILTDLFIDTRNVTYLFNQGRCLEQNQRYEDAIGRFREYLRVGEKLSPADREVAEKHIADCEALLPKPATPPPPLMPPPPSALPPQTLPPSAMPVVTQRAPAASSGSSGLRTAGIVTAAVGAAAVIGGVVLSLKVSSMASDMETTPGGYSAGKESDRKTYTTLGWVSYGVGGAAIATGVILYVLGLRSSAGSSGGMALAPTVAAGQVGAMLKGAF